MNKNLFETDIFDVFLCHNSEDKDEVRHIADILIQHGIRPWLDEQEIIPGTLWQDELEKQFKNIKSVAIFFGQSGIGPWQDLEIKVFLEKFANQQYPLIPVFLPTLENTPLIPSILKNFQAVDFRERYPDPIAGLINGIRSQKKRYTIFPKNTPDISKELDSSQLNHRVYLPIDKPLPRELRSQLFMLADRVTEIWINVVLKQSLINEALILLGKKVDDEKIPKPWNQLIELQEQFKSVANDAPIDAVFDACGRLLILGEPGTGKTTSLLELAESLISRAKEDPSERIPFVLNLSSWHESQTIREWIVERLNRDYSVPDEIGGNWLSNNYLVPLLDGLDEVDSANQLKCVVAINQYIDEEKPPGLVVCSRTSEYQWLPVQLKMYGAVCLELLNHEQINSYLAKLGNEVELLRKSIESDSDLQKIAETPLMLNIMCMTYQSACPEYLPDEKQTIEARKIQIFDAYVEKMFYRKESLKKAFSVRKAKECLHWLANKMEEKSQSVLYIENMQVDWLNSETHRSLYRTISALLFGLFFALYLIPITLLTEFQISFLILGALFFSVLTRLFARLNSSLRIGLFSGSTVFLFCFTYLVYLKEILGGQIDIHDNIITLLIFSAYSGLIIGVGIGPLNSINTIEKIHWSWNSFFKSIISGTSKGFRISFRYSWLPAIIFGIALLNHEDGFLAGIISGFFTAIAIGLFLGFLGGIFMAFTGGFVDSVLDNKIVPNQGIILSLKNSLLTFFKILVFFISIYFFLNLMSSDSKDWVESGLTGVLHGLFMGLIFGLIALLNRGLSATIKHYALRLTLYLTEKTPFKFILLLDYCSKLILLKKVGGGYIFIHRMLLQYFSNLGQENKSDFRTRLNHLGSERNP